jgi:hypothetical protein
MQNSTKNAIFRFVSLNDAFSALRVISDERLITGLDGWRHPTGKDSLRSFDKQLPLIVQKQPPTKFGHADIPSLWTATHFMVALPALSYAITMYGTEDKTTRLLSFSESEVAQYFVAFPHILRHYREYQEFIGRDGTANETWWNEMLGVSFKNVSSFMDMPTVLSDLPLYLRRKVEGVLCGKRDSLEGRLILAYLLSIGLPAEQLQIDERAIAFLSPIGAHAAKSLYERLIHAQVELASLDEYLADYNSETGIKLGRLLGLVSWYARPHLVEMMIPGLVGAAEAAIASLNTLFTHIIRDGGPDYTRMPLPALPSIARFRETQSLVAIGRLSMVLDIVGLDREAEPSAGTIVRKLAISVYDEGERFQAWGNSTYYVPDARADHQSFSVFRQDIGNILYAAAIKIEDQEQKSSVLPQDLKTLAGKVNACRTFAAMRAVIHSNRQVLDNLLADWTKYYPTHERVRLIRFVHMTFGLDVKWPTPVSLDEINKSFIGSHYDGQIYHVVYTEANEHISVDIDLSVSKAINLSKPRVVSYHIDDRGENNLLTAEGIPYSAWLEIVATDNELKPVIIPVPGRGSFDPFGRRGNLHAGEVVGFGCSVHHAALVVILAELASLGAGKADLRRLKSAFMHINEGVHERRDLADYQLAQVVAAYGNHQMYGYADYLANRPTTAIDDKRPHLTRYAQFGKQALEWAEPQSARLAYGYPDLYPHQQEITVDPRKSWYDGSSVHLVDAGGVVWQTLTC